MQRPAGPHAETITAFLRYLKMVGFDGAPDPLRAAAGQELLRFIPGDVAIPPYPAWSQTDEALASIARLLRRFHTASRDFDPGPATTWSDEMADVDADLRAPISTGPTGLLVCHNDVCLENVVFREGEAVALLDFDFAAPGRPLYDVAQFARMCVPLDPDPTGLGWQGVDAAARLAVVAEAYGMSLQEREQFLRLVAVGIARGGQFLLRQVQRGDPHFVSLWESMGGMTRFDLRRSWFALRLDDFRQALGLARAQ